jgi:predicted esterase
MSATRSPTISGFSSGGMLTTTAHTIYSDFFSAAGIFAGFAPWEHSVVSDSYWAGQIADPENF